MPLNAANKDVLTVVTGKSHRYWFAQGDNAVKIPATAEIVNESFDTDFVCQFGNADAGVNELQTLNIAGTTISGTFTIKINNVLGKTGTTAAITYSATAGTMQTNVQNALDALCTSLGFAATLFSVGTPTGPWGANGGDIPITFVGEAAKQNHPLMTEDLTGLTNESGSTGFAETTAGAVPGEAPYTDVDPDGYTASGGITVKPRATVVVAFGTKDDGAGARLNLLGPFFQIACTSGVAQIALTYGWEGVQLKDAGSG